ncbi:MAG TPA: glycosyltransferase family 2 protein [Geomonas sp.]|nr:glycosyltransferase family 2 protein [Geomonas sp.]
MKLDLALVMPVYNEEECIGEVVESWHRELSGLGIAFQMLVLNDGSKDGTAGRLAAFEGRPGLRVINKANSGHGPTILLGYRMAVAEAEWVFQTDSDDEMKPEQFGSLWQRRNDYDALFGWRQGRQQGVGRRLISAVSRQAVALLFSRGVLDVNTPFRLMRSEKLREILPRIPENTFAPNLIISGMLAKMGARIYNHPVPHLGRRTGSVSIVRWKLWKAAFRALAQTIRIALRS